METSYEITDDAKRDVLAATDLVALVGAVTTLKKVGASWKGLCPFHSEKTPSFHVHPAKGFYFCFGCGAKGDAITFVRETERLEFPEAVAYLARQAGVTLPTRRTGSRADRSKDTRASEALKAAARFFRSQLERHTAARRLVERRGLTLEDASEHGLGAAPDAWDALRNALSGAFSEEVLLEAGLLQRNVETGRVYDRFRNRLTIEIRDPRGEVLGFGARALGDEPPKYLNSPETPRFSKGKLLYGLDRAREAIRKSDRVLLVEGYFDRIACERAGLGNAVASMGTALTPAQADLLARQAACVVVAYDGDPPGLAAALKAFPLLLERGVEVKQLVLPGGHDPDSYLAAEGAPALAAAAAAAVPLLSALVARVPAPGRDPELRAERLNEAVAILKSAPDRILRHELLAGLSQATDVPLSALGIGPGKKRGSEPVTALDPPDGPAFPEAEERVLTVLLAEWPESGALVERIPVELFSHEAARTMLSLLKERQEKGLTLDFSELASHLEGAAGRAALRLLFPESDGRPSLGPKPAGEGLGGLHKSLIQLKIRNLEERGAGLQPQIRVAGEAGDGARLDELTREKERLSSEIRRLKQELRRPNGPS